jgi:hypothetical protein
LAGHVFVKAHANQRAARAVQNCGSFGGGPWRLPNVAASFHISVQGSSAEGRYNLPNQIERVLKGNISGYSFQGTWYENVFEGPFKSGNFVANLAPSGGRLTVTFYVANQPFESAEWVCGSGPAPEPTATPDVVPTPPPEPTPTPTPFPDSDHDQDDFKIFDSLPPDQQRAVLVRRGPRFPIAYKENDLSMRVLVKSNWPIIIDYGLVADNYALFSIEFPNRRPLNIKVHPTRRDQITLAVPQLDTDDYQVAKVRIKTMDERDRFRLYGFGMGEKATQALRQIDADLSRFALALNSADPSLMPLMAPQIGTSIQISVSLPASLKAKQKPEQHIEFSCTSSSDFSEGRFEWWRVKGLDWEKVWQKGSGALSRNQTRSQTWNGVITRFKLISKGFHALSFVAWQKAGEEHEWVAARTDPALEVID